MAKTTIMQDSTRLVTRAQRELILATSRGQGGRSGLVCSLEVKRLMESMMGNITCNKEQQTSTMIQGAPGKLCLLGVGTDMPWVEERP